MADFAPMVLTNAGLAIQTQAQAGAALKFSRIAIGDGARPADFMVLDAMVNEHQSTLPSEFEALDLGRARLRAVFNNRDLLAAQEIRELGVFAIDPTDASEKLYSYTHAGAGYDTIPPGGGGTPVELVYDIHTLIGTASNVSATLASNVYASADALADLETRSEAAVAALLALTAANTNERLKGIF